MTKEESIKRLKLLLQDDCVCEECIKNKEVIETVLSLIEKQSRQIEEKENRIRNLNKEAQRYFEENIRLDKVIELMAEILVKVPETIDNPQSLAIIKAINSDLEEKKKYIKEYFEKEAGKLC